MKTFRQFLLETESQDDYNLEKDFVLKFLKDAVQIEQFPYYEDYVRTASSEAKLIQGNCLFIGGGPVPMTPIMLNRDHGINVEAMDYSSEAVRLSKAMLQKMGLPIRVFLGDGTRFQRYRKYQTIFVSLEAGNTEELKRAIFDNIKSQITPHHRVLIRGSNVEETMKPGEQFTNVGPYVENYFSVKARVPVFSNLSTTYVLHCEMCPT